MKKIILSGILIIIIALTLTSCDWFDDEGDCSDNEEDAFISDLGTLPSSPTPIHPNDVNPPEFCNPKYYNCTSCPSNWRCNCRNITGSGFYDCDCEFPGCEGCTVVFEENCVRHPQVDDYGLFCGRWGKGERPRRGDEVIHEDGFMPRANAGMNIFSQCFVARYLDETGGDPTSLASYFPLPYPEITVTARRCDGVPERTIFKYTTNGLTIEIDNQYYDDCMACPSMVIKINDVPYNLRQDPYCGRDIPGSGWGGNYCSAGAHNTTTTTS